MEALPPSARQPQPSAEKPRPAASACLLCRMEGGRLGHGGGRVWGAICPVSPTLGRAWWLLSVTWLAGLFTGAHSPREAGSPAARQAGPRHLGDQRRHPACRCPPPLPLTVFVDSCPGWTPPGATRRGRLSAPWGGSTRTAGARALLPADPAPRPGWTLESGTLSTHRRPQRRGGRALRWPPPRALPVSWPLWPAGQLPPRPSRGAVSSL